MLERVLAGEREGLTYQQNIRDYAETKRGLKNQMQEREAMMLCCGAVLNLCKVLGLSAGALSVEGVPSPVLCWLQASFPDVGQNSVVRRPADCRTWTCQRTIFGAPKCLQTGRALAPKGQEGLAATRERFGGPASH